MGRTGTWFAHDTSGVTPDLVTLAKGLAGGIPIGACVAVGEAGGLLQPGNHGTTFGGNPVAAAAALAVIETIESEHLLDNVVKVGARLAEELADPRVTEVRQHGLLIGVDLSEPVAAAAVTAAMKHGVIINNTGPDRIRLAPPLILTEEQAAAFGAAWPQILDEAFSEVTS
jgi:acetylornithine aminotransferase